jgi:MFS family permease
MNVVIIERALQGLGGVILAGITMLKELPIYMDLMAIAISIGTILCPFGGALFGQNINWRWIGWINLPLIGLIFLLAFFFLHWRRLKTSSTQSYVA